MTASGVARFQSRTDWWLATVLYIAVFISLGGASTLLFANTPGGFLANIALVLLGAVLPLWVLLHTHYTITDSGLRITSGPFRWRIPLHEIRSITPTRNPLSSPALSLDRLRIEYGRGKWIMVSPRDKEHFLRELKKQGVAI